MNHKFHHLEVLCHLISSFGYECKVLTKSYSKPMIFTVCDEKNNKKKKIVDFTMFFWFEKA
jgi:hypothetical protein